MCDRCIFRYGKRGGTQTPTSNLYGRSGNGNPFEWISTYTKYKVFEKLIKA